MAMFRAAIFMFVFVVVTSFSSTANGKLITKCVGAYAQECSDQESSAGFEKCCSLMVNLYKTDADCLCSIYEYIDMDNEAANKKLSECGITTKTPFSCNFKRDRILRGSEGSLHSPLSEPSPSSTESPFSPEIEESAGYKKTARIPGIISLAFISLFVGFVVA